MGREASDDIAPQMPGARLSTLDPRLSTKERLLPFRPAQICGQLLAALDASEGRRRRRKRNTTPDAIGMAIKRRLLEETVRDDPDPGDFEGWLLQHSEDEPSTASGPARAMALDVLADWRLAERSDGFRSWLEQGAPSEDGGR